nr:hypothetical protein GCM10020093_047820 [Planobispora longispora]
MESRDRDIDEGIGALRRLLGDWNDDLEEVCDLTIGAQRPGHERDDIALLLARVRELSPDEVAELTLPAETEVVARARRFARATLTDWGWTASSTRRSSWSANWSPTRSCTARGRSACAAARPAAGVRGVGPLPAVPILLEATGADDSGRGLRLVNRIARRWGFRPTPEGKIVWAEQNLP